MRWNNGAFEGNGGYWLVGKVHYGCANACNRGACDNRLTIRRDVLEATVLNGLRDNLLHPDLIREFVEEYRLVSFCRLRHEAAIRNLSRQHS